MGMCNKVTWQQRKDGKGRRRGEGDGALLEIYCTEEISRTLNFLVIKGVEETSGLGLIS